METKLYSVPVRLTAGFNVVVRAENEEQAVKAATSIKPINLFVNDDEFCDLELDEWSDYTVSECEPDDLLFSECLWDETGYFIHNFPSELYVVDIAYCQSLFMLLSFFYRDDNGDVDYLRFDADFKAAQNDDDDHVDDVLEHMVRMRMLL